MTFLLLIIKKSLKKCCEPSLLINHTITRFGKFTPYCIFTTVKFFFFSQYSENFDSGYIHFRPQIIFAKGFSSLEGSFRKGKMALTYESLLSTEHPKVARPGILDGMGGGGGVISGSNLLWQGGGGEHGTGLSPPKPQLLGKIPENSAKTFKPK